MQAAARAYFAPVQRKPVDVSEGNESTPASQNALAKHEIETLRKQASALTRANGTLNMATLPGRLSDTESQYAGTRVPCWT